VPDAVDELPDEAPPLNVTVCPTTKVVVKLVPEPVTVADPLVTVTVPPMVPGPVEKEMGCPTASRVEKLVLVPVTVVEP
jgi:hypothetical protein